jgi:hypothetical protein
MRRANRAVRCPLQPANLESLRAMAVGTAPTASLYPARRYLWLEGRPSAPSPNGAFCAVVSSWASIVRFAAIAAGAACGLFA